MSEFEQEEAYVCQDCGYGEVEQFTECPECNSKNIRREKLWFWIYDDEIGFKTLKEAIDYVKRWRGGEYGK